MADVLVVGVSHYPPLAMPDERMSGILQKMLTNPDLPANLKNQENWPTGVHSEWGDDKGVKAAGVHREKLVTEMRKVRAAIDEFQSDFVLMWGDDQYENFREDVIPPYCVCAFPSFEFAPHPGNVWGEGPEQAYKLPGVPKAAKHLASELISAGFDAAYAYQPLHDTLGHAFANAVFYLDYDRKGWSYPILPVSINCYGRHVISQRGGLPNFDRPALKDEDFDPPAPTPKRLFDMGAATARILQDSPYRVALLSSSGWSHAFLTPKTNYLWPDTPADRLLYEALRTGDYETWRNYPANAIEESGQQEVLNWMALAGALKELKRKPKYTSFVDTWIFNSSKCFLISPPN
ncbi:MAG: extradiol ring-cleavage dioxygenase [Hyphomonadaceae bacterium]